MIRILKPTVPPSILRTRGVRATLALSTAHGKKRTIKFDPAIYAHESVKTALREAQHSKCAFCESNVTHISYGDVEHFRPKTGWRQTKKAPLVRPGYYWLAYDWNNLFLSCTLCNQQFKKNLFPLRTPSRRARNHRQDVTAEDPLLLHPSMDDPEAFISFREEVPYAIRGNRRGKTTIRTLGLLRPELAEQRRERLEKVKALKRLVEIGDSEAPWAQALLQKMQQDSEEYASMTRAFLR